MILVIGGAWQGKLAFAERRWGLAPDEIFFCTETPCDPPEGVRCVCGLHRALLGRTRAALREAGVAGVPAPGTAPGYYPPPGPAEALCVLPAGERGLDMAAQASAACTGWAERMLPRWKNTVVLCDDISSGVVPLGADLRCWREAAGRTLALLADRSDEVYRLFCGLETRLK